MNAPVELPPHVVVLRDFANTYDAEDDIESLPTPDDLVRWLRHYALLPDPSDPIPKNPPPNEPGPNEPGPNEPGPNEPGPNEPAPNALATARDLDRAHALRDGLRRAMTQHHDGASAPLPQLDALARALPLRVDFTTDRPRLCPVGDGVDAGLAGLLVAVMAAQADRSWPRLKLCHASDCLWAFYDVSKNRSRTWCAMGVCGNRAKTRSYRARRRGTEPAPSERP